MGDADLTGHAAAAVGSAFEGRARVAERLTLALKGRLLRTPAEPLAYFLSSEFVPIVRTALDPTSSGIHTDNKYLLQSIRKVATPDMRCIDVGAHIGYFLRAFEKCAPQGRHIAVEPLARKARWLRMKFPNAQIFESALADRAGKSVFVENIEQSAYSGLRTHMSPDAAARPHREIQIDVRTLDDIASEGPRVGMIKIDAEGAECAILRGGARLIARDRPVILFECGAVESPVDRCGAVFDELAAHGYRIFTVKDFALGGPRLSRETFDFCRTYPAISFNFVAAP